MVLFLQVFDGKGYWRPNLQTCLSKDQLSFSPTAAKSASIAAKSVAENVHSFIKPFSAAGAIVYCLAICSNSPQH